MKPLFAGRKLTVFLHLLAWAVILGLPVYFLQRWTVGKEFVWLYYVTNIISGLVFYSNYLVLVPKYFFKPKKARYYLSVLILLIFLYLVSRISGEVIFSTLGNRDEGRMEPKIERREPGPPQPLRFPGKLPGQYAHFFNYMFTSLFMVFFSLGLRIMERHSEIEKAQKDLEKEKLNSELAFLKNQISPHFFFNTLNNIYSLISINPDDSQKAVLKLSKLMRYLLYESDHGNTLLSNEIAFMNNYIDLMKLRMSEKVALTVSFPDKYDDVSVPPLLFIPFIENAFKHGVSYRVNSFIDIKMEATREKIEFHCANSLVPVKDEVDRSHNGIGLENVSKRLALLFPERHVLKISRSDNAFMVDLLINFV